MSNVQKYRSVTSETEAIQYDGNNPRAIIDFVGNENCLYVPESWHEPDRLHLYTKAGLQKVEAGDYVVLQPYPTGERDYYALREVVFLRRYIMSDRARKDDKYERLYYLVIGLLTGATIALQLAKHLFK